MARTYDSSILIKLTTFNVVNCLNDLYRGIKTSAEPKAQYFLRDRRPDKNFFANIVDREYKKNDVGSQFLVSKITLVSPKSPDASVSSWH